MKYTMIVNRGEITLDSAKGTITGATYGAKNWIKDEFPGAKWDGSRKAWIVDGAAIDEDMTKYHDYYVRVNRLQVVEEQVTEPVAEPVKVEATEPTVKPAEVKAAEPAEAKTPENTVETREYHWVTEKGAAIRATITVEHITSETRSADGWEYTAKCDRWMRRVNKLTVNGKDEIGHLDAYGTESVISFWIGRQRAMIRIPQDVQDAIFGEEREARKRHQEIVDRVEAKYEAHRSAVLKAMDAEDDYDD